MMLKEFKKIISNRWIVFLLILLSFINVFLDVKVTEKDWVRIEQEHISNQEKIDAYSEYIENIRSNADILATFDLFNDGSDYQAKSAGKVVEAYDVVKSVKPVNGNYTAVEKFTTIGFTDIIIFIIMLQCIIVVINTDVKYGMLTLLKSCKKGRVRLVLDKMGAIFLADLLVTFCVFAIHGISLYATYGCDSLNVPLQSVMEFYESSLPITIGQYIILFFVLKVLATFAYSIIIFAIAIVCSNSGIVYSTVGVIMVASFITYTRILWDYAIAPLKIISPITLIDVRAVTCKYYNINMFGNPVNIMSVAIAVIILYIVILGLVSVVLFSKNINVTFRLRKKNTNKKQTRKMHIKGMLAMEYKKVLITNKGIVIILILIILQGFVISEVDTELSDEQKFYAGYMNDIEGPQSKETDKYIDTENKRYKELTKEYENHMEQFMAGEIDQTVMIAIQEQYDWDMYPYPAFEKVKAQRKYLNRLEKEQNIKGWFVNDIGINYLIHPELIYSENIAWIFMMMAIILLVIACMGYEEQTRMDRLTDTMICGTRKLFQKKVVVSLGITTIVFLISNLPYFLLVTGTYEFGGVLAPLKSLQEFEHFALNISVTAYLIALYIFKFIVSLLAMTLVIIISRKCKGYIKKIAFSVTLIIVPMLIFTVL